MKIFEITENISHTSKNLRDTERDRDVKIGSDEWFKLWFSLPYLKEAKLTELFNDIYPYQIRMQTRAFTVYEFGDDISVTIEKLEDGDDYYVLSFDKDGEEGATGDGDQFKVFGTVMAIANDFIKQQAPSTFKFSAEKVDRNTGATGRPKLYSRLSKMLARQSGYDVTEKSNGRYVDYILTRKQDVKESNPFTDARMNAIKAGKTVFKVGGKTYKVTGDTSDEREAVANEKLDEETGKEMLKIFRGMHHDAGMNKDMDRYIRSHDWQLGDFTPDMFPSEEEFFDYDDPFDRIIDIDYSHRVNLSAPIIAGPQFSDGKYSVIDGNHRAAAAQRMGKTIQAYFPVAKTNENFADGKKPGRKGLAKRVGVNTKASVSDLRKTAKNSSGEKQRMAHWLANMKSGRKKASESILEDDEEEIYYSKKFASVAKKIFKSMYPDVKVNAKEDEDGYLVIETADGVFGFSMGVTHQYGDNVITVANAYAGQYKGVVGQLVKSAAEFLKQKHPDAETTLVAQHDVSDNYWPQLANKLGINYENNEW
jgi:hypothetical protein